jgi:hypothetical protein
LNSKTGETHGRRIDCLQAFDKTVAKDQTDPASFHIQLWNGDKVDVLQAGLIEDVEPALANVFDAVDIQMQSDLASSDQKCSAIVHIHEQ